MNFNKITPLIVTYNEELNIYNNLKQLINFKKVLVFDQFSKDKTTKIIKKFKNTFVIKVKPQEITKKYNQILLSSKIKTNWIILLSADHILTKKFKNELKNLNLDEYNCCKYGFEYIVKNKKINSIYPPVNYFFNKKIFKFKNEGHSVFINLKNKKKAIKQYYFKNKILHNDKKPIDRFYYSQLPYAKQQLNFILKKKNIRFIDKIRLRFVFTPLLVFIYTYIFKLTFISSKRGLFYAYQKLLYETVFQLNLLERKKINAHTWNKFLSS
jgi:hypothetical protein